MTTWLYDIIHFIPFYSLLNFQSKSLYLSFVHLVIKKRKNLVAATTLGGRVTMTMWLCHGFQQQPVITDLDRSNRKRRLWKTQKPKANNMASASEIVAKLNLAAHPEGGFYSETFRDHSILLSKSQLPPECKFFLSFCSYICCVFIIL